MTQTPAQDLQLSEEFRAMKNLIDRLKIETELGSSEGGFRTDVASIMENILRAETEDEVFARQDAGTVATKDYVNRPFRLTPEDVTWKMTGPAFREAGAFPFYALIKVTDVQSGDSLILNGGGATFVAVLDRLIQLGGLSGYENEGGRTLMIVEKPVASGFSVLLLKPVATGKKASATKTSGNATTN